MIMWHSAGFVLIKDFDKEREEFCNQVLEARPTHLFPNIVWEAFSFDQWILPVDEFMYKHGIPTTWVVTNWSKNEPGWKQLKCPVAFFDYFLWRSYNETVNKKKSGLNPRWNPDADKFLFLTGKPDKRHRIGLLYQLHKQNLTATCLNSLFMHPGVYKKSKKYVPELSDSEFREFVEQYQKTPDNAAPFMQEDSMHYGGLPYDHTMYANSKFRLISETSMHLERPWLTEKTWLTIANRNPFVIAGERHSCQYLRSLGIEPFDRLFDILSYDNSVTERARLIHVVNHVEQWVLGNFNKTEVADMVEHNYNRFVELSVQARQEFEEFAKCDIDLAINTCDDMTGF